MALLFLAIACLMKEKNIVRMSAAVYLLNGFYITQITITSQTNGHTWAFIFANILNEILEKKST